ncbi:MAG: gluconate 2-dehydrogenase subunit 3 family protein [Deltaproteobacteria bacterium]|nr:gluconate 2-dehydrogenase subunit 3 family protein [Deltaproteobacteria bacterium]
MKLDRREALLALLGGGASAGLATWQLWPPAPALKADPPASPFEEGTRRTLAAAVERLLPGAVEAGVPEYLDYWMAREPWVGFLAAGMRTGAGWLDRLARAEHQRDFAALEGAQQDELLGRCQRGELPGKGFSGRAFFEYLLQFTLEGFLSDPVYGGNRGEVGWRHIGHAACHWAPGAGPGKRGGA